VLSDRNSNWSVRPGPGRDGRAVAAAASLTLTRSGFRLGKVADPLIRCSDCAVGGTGRRAEALRARSGGSGLPVPGPSARSREPRKFCHWQLEINLKSAARRQLVVLSAGHLQVYLEPWYPMISYMI
jgi:hypothetical protein